MYFCIISFIYTCIVYIYIYIYVYISICLCIYNVSTCVWMYIHICIYVCVCVYMHIYYTTGIRRMTYTCIYVYIFILFNRDTGGEEGGGDRRARDLDQLARDLDRESVTWFNAAAEGGYPKVQHVRV